MPQGLESDAVFVSLLLGQCQVMGKAVPGTRINLSILGESRPTEVSDGRRRALCSATALSLQVSCPSRRDLESSPVLLLVEHLHGVLGSLVWIPLIPGCV